MQFAGRLSDHVAPQNGARPARHRPGQLRVFAGVMGAGSCLEPGGLTMPDGSNITEETAAKAANGADFVTILTSVDTEDCMGAYTPAPRRLTKTIFRNEDGSLGVRDYDRATWYSMRPVPIAGLAGLKAVEDEIGPHSHSVNGEIVPGTDTDRARRLHVGDKATLRER